MKVKGWTYILLFATMILTSCGGEKLIQKTSDAPKAESAEFQGKFFDAQAEKAKGKTVIYELQTDIKRLNEVKPPAPDKLKRRAAVKSEIAPDVERVEFKAKRRRTPTSRRKKRRPNNPTYKRDCPTPGL